MTGIGQPEYAQESALIEDLKAGRLSHALLLSGPKGTGKKTLAAYLAKGLMCTAADTRARPCGLCKNCRRFDRDALPDLLKPRIKKEEKNIKLEAVRDLMESLSRHPLENGNRVVLIGNAERLTPGSQNALLKSIEEPDGSTYFLLTADSVRAILPTILSRCWVARLPLWSNERMTAELKKHGIPADRIADILPLAGGSIGQALQINRDEHFREDVESARRVFFDLRVPSDIPPALKALKDRKEHGDRILEIAEEEFEILVRDPEIVTDPALTPWKKLDLFSLKNILNAIVEAKKYRQFNVGLTAAAEKAMSVITEEAVKWQL